MRTIQENWAAGETKLFQIRGGRFELLDCPYPVDASFMDDNGTELTNGKAQNIASGSYRHAPFGCVAITSTQAQQIKFLISDGDAGTRSIAGTVQVVDGGKARSLAGVAFMANTYRAAVAEQFAQVQLFNPADSGKNLIVVQIMANSSSAGGGLAMLSGQVELTTYVGAPKAKRFGMPDSTARINSQNAAGALIGTQFGSLDGSLKNFKFVEPIIVPPGWGMSIANATAGADLGATFEFFEEKI